MMEWTFRDIRLGDVIRVTYHDGSVYQFRVDDSAMDNERVYDHYGRIYDLGNANKVVRVKGYEPVVGEKFRGLTGGLYIYTDKDSYFRYAGDSKPWLWPGEEDEEIRELVKID